MTAAGKGQKAMEDAGLKHGLFTYYFLKNGRMERYSGKKKELFDMLPGYDEELELYMRKNRLEYNQRGDLLRITAYYNELKNN